MSDQRATARNCADELAAGAVNGQDNEERFDADEEERIEAEVERRLAAKLEEAVEREVEERLERQEEADAERFEEAVEREVEKRLEEADAEVFEDDVEREVEKRLVHFRESAEFKMAVEEAVEAARADASKFERHASNSDGPEIGTATDLAGILAEMREEFQGGDVAGVMAREFADRIEAAVGTGGVKGDTKANLATSLRDAVNAAKREAEEFGVAWDRTNTEPAVKTFRVELALDVSDRLKLGILAARCNVTPERWLHDFLYGKFADFCASVFDKRHGNPMCDDALAQCAYEALYPTALSAIFGANGGARLVFKPAVMA